MLESVQAMVVGGALALLVGILCGMVLVKAARRMMKQGIMFGLIGFGFLVSMATKPGPTPPEPEPTVVTNTVVFLSGEYGVFAGGSTQDVQKVASGESAIAPSVLPDAGYDFFGWDQPFDSVTNDLTITAQYTQLVYTITYDNLKGAANPNPATFTVTSSFEFAAPGAVKGWEFAGWSPRGIAEGTASNVTATANWTEVQPEPEPEPPVITNTVVFLSGEHGVLVDGTTQFVEKVISGESAIAPSVLPDAGYDFFGWDQPFDSVTNDLTITAQYTQLVYTITYNNLKGAANPNPVTFTVTNSFEFAAPGAVKGWEFAGWSPRGIAEGTANNVTATANWTEVQPEPEPEPPVITNTVVFLSGEHGVLVDGTTQFVEKVISGESAIAPSVLPDAGYDFFGWDQPFDSVTNDLTITAQYTQLVYTITYNNLNGAANTNPATFTVTSSFEFAAPGAVKGWEFAGWSPRGIAEGTASNVTATANWTEFQPEPEPEPPVVTNTVVFLSGEHGVFADGSTRNVQKVENGQSAIAPLVKPDDGYIFSDWDQPFDSVTNDLTVTAQWEEYYGIVKRGTWPLTEEGTVSVTQGTSVTNWTFDVPETAKVTVSGLPSGLKYKNGAITGAATRTKDGGFIVTFKTTMNRETTKEQVTIYVEANPCTGSWYGVQTNSYETTLGATVTAAAGGSVKLILTEGTKKTTFSAKCLDADGKTATLTARKRIVTVDFAEGAVREDGATLLPLFRAQAFEDAPQITTVVLDDYAYLTATYNFKRGTFAVSGKLWDGTSLRGTGYALENGWVSPIIVKNKAKEPVSVAFGYDEESNIVRCLVYEDGEQVKIGGDGTTPSWGTCDTDDLKRQKFYDLSDAETLVVTADDETLTLAIPENKLKTSVATTGLVKFTIKDENGRSWVCELLPVGMVDAEPENWTFRGLATGTLKGNKRYGAVVAE